ncbi:CMRF35-like molecule 3 [Stegastes partitus]|uniref:CMRF35-like molecule 3 n=1 Tax=Stegastes partitus TaxID=144197 RepID=A0A9Y4MX50_9TELE|nr:PREDICTED: CMRF35-like molecule 3 [Stegastes partitus]
MSLILLLLCIVLLIPIMRTSGICAGIFKAPVLCFLWLTKHTVDSAQLSAPEVVTGTYNGSVTISCQYSLQFKEYTKYWCKGQVYELCTIIVKTPKVRQNDRSSIVDDKEAGVFTVTMTLLQKTDEDMYWCVIARHGRNIFSRVRLLVSDTVTTPLTTTQINSFLILEQEQTSWWAALRWILFILMLCCLASTHIIVWWTKAEKKIPFFIKTQT